MARILEALKKADMQRRFRPAPGQPTPERPLGDEEEVPFIKVGGVSAPVEGSPAVLAAAVPGKPANGQPPNLAHIDMPWVTPVLSVVGSTPLSVAFRPLPIEAPLGPTPELMAFHQPEHPLSRQYGELLASLRGQLPGESAIVLFTGCANEAGRTIMLLNLAITYAREGTGRVALVDAGSGLIARKLGMAAAPGLREVVAGRASLRDSVRESRQPNLHVLSSGDQGAMDGTALDRVRSLLHQLRDHFDWVLVDGPSWDDGPMASGLAVSANAIYLVVRQAEVKTPQTEGVMLRICQRGGRLCGYIVTQP